MRRTEIRRTTAGLIVALALLAAPLAADAQQPGKVPRIGFLWASSPSDPASQRYREVFRRGLRDLGYIEGQNIAIESRSAEGKYDRLPGLAAELVRLQVDVIVAVGAAAPAAKQATTTTPIVMVGAGAAVEAGLVASLARPGGNITGLTQMLPELTAKRLELLKEAVPKVSRVAVLWNSANPVKALDWREIQVAARALGVTLQSVEVQEPDEFDRALAAIPRGHPDALITLDDSLTFLHRTRIVNVAAKSRLPAMYGLTAFAEAGGLMAYGPNVPDLFRRAATFVDKILKGAKPADLPVEQPTRFELVVNLKTAKALGLTIPQSVLIRADQVIQ